MVVFQFKKKQSNMLDVYLAEFDFGILWTTDWSKIQGNLSTNMKSVSLQQASILSGNILKSNYLIDDHWGEIVSYRCFLKIF